MNHSRNDRSAFTRRGKRFPYWKWPVSSSKLRRCWRPLAMEASRFARIIWMFCSFPSNTFDWIGFNVRAIGRDLITKPRARTNASKGPLRPSPAASKSTLSPVILSWFLCGYSPFCGQTSVYESRGSSLLQQQLQRQIDGTIERWADNGR